MKLLTLAALTFVALAAIPFAGVDGGAVPAAICGGVALVFGALLIWAMNRPSSSPVGSTETSAGSVLSHRGDSPTTIPPPVDGGSHADGRGGS